MNGRPPRRPRRPHSATSRCPPAARPGTLEGEPRLSADGVRYVLAACQAAEGDPAKVYRHFLGASRFVGMGLATAIPIEAVLPTAADMENARKARDGQV